VQIILSLCVVEVGKSLWSATRDEAAGGAVEEVGDESAGRSQGRCTVLLGRALVLVMAIGVQGSVYIIRTCLAMVRHKINWNKIS
jgi:hypothetical protein